MSRTYYSVCHTGVAVCGMYALSIDTTARRQLSQKVCLTGTAVG